MSTPTLHPGLDPPRTGASAGVAGGPDALPRAIDALKHLAEEYGVCVRPLALRRTDLDTGLTEVIDLPCGATREDKCPPCAKRGRRLRQAQIREGWHRTDEPNPGPNRPTEEQKALIRVAGAPGVRPRRRRARRPVGPGRRPRRGDPRSRRSDRGRGAAGPGRATAPTATRTSDDEGTARRKRSTRRRQDAPDLPRQQVEPRTVGRAYTAPDGTTYRPSMWLTLTLDSYGPCTPASGAAPTRAVRRAHGDDDAARHPVDPTATTTGGRPGTPSTSPAAGPVLAEPAPLRRLERPVRRLRRAATPPRPTRALRHPRHHPRATARAGRGGHLPPGVVADRRRIQRYTVDRPPVWDADRRRWVDPDTRRAADHLGRGPRRHRRRPGRRTRRTWSGFGAQVDARGVKPGTRGRRTRPSGYITKYITKDTADCHKPRTDRAARRTSTGSGTRTAVTPVLRPVRELAALRRPARRRPRQAQPGRCKGKVHQRATLGIGGRRILISRDWSGKTLADHRARRPGLGPRTARRQRRPERPRPGRRRAGRSRAGTPGNSPGPSDPDVHAARPPAPALHHRTRPLALRTARREGPGRAGVTRRCFGNCGSRSTDHWGGNACGR